jgi:hypothetical protein
VAALLFLAACASAPPARATLEPADEAAQRLFDDAFKLWRRFIADSISSSSRQFEPLQSELLELSNFHENATARPWDDSGTKRLEPMAIGPWALEHLGYLKEAQGSPEEALELYQRLGTEFQGLEVDDINPLEQAPTSIRMKIVREKAELISLHLCIMDLMDMHALLKYKKKAGDEVLKPIREQAFGLMVQLQKTYGSLTCSCPVPPCGTYGDLARDELWEFLKELGADAQEWKVRTLNLESFEKDPKAVARTYMAMSGAYAELGQAEMAADFKKRALKSYAQAVDLDDLPFWALDNLLPHKDSDPQIDKK